ncbi:hypothetical protein GCM10027403_34300 [Arthrobacter tecti]
MTAVVLTWSPDHRGWPGHYPEAVQRTRESGGLALPWTVEGLSDQPLRSDAWLLGQGDLHRWGVTGHGILTSDPSDGSVDALLELDCLLPFGDGIPIHQLLQVVSEVDWSDPPAAQLLPAEYEASMRTLWSEHVAPASASIDPPSGMLPAHSLKRVFVNQFEHDPDATRVAVAHHGSQCRACGFDFEVKYGKRATGLVHVHHVVPAAQLTASYELDPVADLIPLCPNCHFMAHSRHPDPFSVAELRSMIDDGGHLPGTVVTEQQLRAEEFAQRLTEE